MRILTTALYCLSLLPLSVLYGLSNLVKWVLQYLVKYRREVIFQNIQRSFPELSATEVKRIANAYYAHLADLIVETIKLQSIEANSLAARCTYLNPEVLEDHIKNGRAVIIMMGHSGNWEWAGAATALRSACTLLPIYRKVKSEAFDRYFLALRSRFGSVPVQDRVAVDAIRKHPAPYVVAMLADQTPSGKKGIWMEFLHQATPFYRGTEVLVKRLGCEVVFAHVRKQSRGHYRIYYENYMGESQNQSITSAFAKFLEREIRAQPENWLWSHKRWKHRPEENSVWAKALDNN